MFKAHIETDFGTDKVHIFVADDKREMGFAGDIIHRNMMEPVDLTFRCISLKPGEAQPKDTVKPTFVMSRDLAVGFIQAVYEAAVSHGLIQHKAEVHQMKALKAEIALLKKQIVIVTNYGKMINRRQHEHLNDLRTMLCLPKAEQIPWEHEQMEELARDEAAEPSSEPPF